MKRMMMIRDLMNYIVLTSVILICAFLFSCNDAAENHSQDSHENHHPVHSSGVILNNNEKWKANEETNKGIANMMMIVKNEKSEGNNSDCKQLQSKLNAEFDQIFQKCTMTGEAHNQLHNYLMPLSSYIERLDIVKEAECRTTINTIEDYLTEYSVYFE